MENKSNVFAVFAFVFVVIAIVWGFVWLMASNNVATPAGYVGYITQGSVFGESRFIGVQTGPTSTGKNWLFHCVNVSVTPYTYDEPFEGDKAVLSRDHMQISFSAHITFRVDPAQVREFVEHYSTMRDGQEPEQIVRTAYDNFLKERLRTFVRDEIQRYDWQELTNRIDTVSEAVLAKVKQLTVATPFDVASVVVGNIQFPPAIAQSVADAQSASQILQRKEMEIKQAEADARKRVAEAHGVAEAMDIVQKKLTGSYLQHEAIEAQKLMVNSPSHTVIYIPCGPNGVPLVNTIEGGK
jgi:regulator of protease activity HflC (stomatin/prohibitin superfamily)